MARIATLGPARLPFLMAICALLSCTGDIGTGTPGGNDRIQLAVLVTFPSSATNAQPIVTIRVTTLVVPPGTQIAQDDVSVDPNNNQLYWDQDGRQVAMQGLTHASTLDGLVEGGAMDGNDYSAYGHLLPDTVSAATASSGAYSQAGYVDPYHAAVAA